MRTAVDENKDLIIKIGEYKRLIKQVREMREEQLKKKSASVLENKVDQKLKEIL